MDVYSQWEVEENISSNLLAKVKSVGSNGYRWSSLVTPVIFYTFGFSYAVDPAAAPARPGSLATWVQTSPRLTMYSNGLIDFRAASEVLSNV